MSSGGSKGEQSQSTQVDIPGFLQSFLNQGSDVAGSALGNIQNLAGSDLVAGFSPEQEQAFQQASDVAGGAGGFIPTAQDQLLQTAQGRDLSSFLDPSALSALTGAAGASGLEFLPPEALAALTSTASGDFLSGGEGFQGAVDAAVRSATPSIASAFGGTAGGLSGGLARQAVGDTAVDAFASQFANERRNQLNAANILGGFGEGEQGRGLQAAGLLGQFGAGERGRQEGALGQLPGAGLLSSDILSQIGGQRQQLAQDQLSSPFESQLQLLQAALAGLPIESLLGQSSQGEFSRFGFEGGFPDFSGLFGGSTPGAG